MYWKRNSEFCVVLTWQVGASNAPSGWIECNWFARQLICAGLFGSWHKIVACQEGTEVNPAYFFKEKALFCHKLVSQHLFFHRFLHQVVSTFLRTQHCCECWRRDWKLETRIPLHGRMFWGLCRNSASGDESTARSGDSRRGNAG